MQEDVIAHLLQKLNTEMPEPVFYHIETTNSPRVLFLLQGRRRFISVPFEYLLNHSLDESYQQVITQLMLNDDDEDEENLGIEEERRERWSVFDRFPAEIDFEDHLKLLEYAREEINVLLPIGLVGELDDEEPVIIILAPFVSDDKDSFTVVCRVQFERETRRWYISHHANHGRTVRFYIQDKENLHAALDDVIGTFMDDVIHQSLAAAAAENTVEGETGRVLVEGFLFDKIIHAHSFTWTEKAIHLFMIMFESLRDDSDPDQALLEATKGDIREVYELLNIDSFLAKISAMMGMSSGCKEQHTDPDGTFIEKLFNMLSDPDLSWTAKGVGAFYEFSYASSGL